MSCLILIFLLGLSLTTVEGELFSSMTQVLNALKIVKRENPVVVFKRNAHESKNDDEMVKAMGAIAKDLRNLVHAAEFDRKHPVDIYKFVRLCSKLHTTKAALDKAGDTTFQNDDVKKFLESIPDFEDFIGSATGLMRLYRVYRLNLADIINGQIAGKKTSPMDTFEVLDLVNVTMPLSHVVKTNMRNVSLQILNILNETRAPEMTKMEKVSLLLLLLRVYSEANCMCTAEMRTIRREFFRIDPDYAKRVLTEEECIYVEECRSLMMAIRLHRQDERYYRLCRNEPIEPSDLAKRYSSITNPSKVCINYHNNDPVIRIQPFKFEILNDKLPYMVIVHDIIRDGDIDRIKAYSTKHLKRGTVTTREGQIPSINKISQTMILPSTFTLNNLMTFRNRLRLLTTLNNRGYELLQVANYGVGGVYNIHVDFSFNATRKNFSLATNARVVTITTYLNDVESGGTTVFPELGLRSQPKKGNALMFFNLFRNGTGNWATKHASCPVLYGEKWITNQWVSRYHNEFTYPCTTSWFE